MSDRSTSELVRLRVRCTLEVEVELDLEPEYNNRQHIEFLIENNGCPGTGVVGAAIDKVYEKARENWTCWACNLKGRNEIIAAPWMPVSKSTTS